jgi:hypothetical protein
MRLVTNNYDEFVRAAVNNPTARVRAEGNQIVFYTGLDKALHTVKHFNEFSTHDKARFGYEVSQCLSAWKRANQQWNEFGEGNLFKVDGEGMSVCATNVLKTVKPALFNQDGSILDQEKVVALASKVRRYEHRVALLERGFNAEKTYVGASISSSNTSLNTIPTSFKEAVPVFCSDVPEHIFEKMLEELDEGASYAERTKAQIMEERDASLTARPENADERRTMLDKDFNLVRVSESERELQSSDVAIIDRLYQEIQDMIVKVNYFGDDLHKLEYDEGFAEDFKELYPQYRAEIIKLTNAFSAAVKDYYAKYGMKEPVFGAQRAPNYGNLSAYKDLIDPDSKVRLMADLKYLDKKLADLQNTQEPTGPVIHSTIPKGKKNGVASVPPKPLVGGPVVDDDKSPVSFRRAATLNGEAPLVGDYDEDESGLRPLPQSTLDSLAQTRMGTEYQTVYNRATAVSSTTLSLGESDNENWIDYFKMSAPQVHGELTRVINDLTVNNRSMSYFIPSTYATKTPPKSVACVRTMVTALTEERNYLETLMAKHNVAVPKQ